jgi:hypothetical protein
MALMVINIELVQNFQNNWERISNVSKTNHNNIELKFFQLTI